MIPSRRMSAKQALAIICAAMFIAGFVLAQAPKAAAAKKAAPPDPGQSPAARPHPKQATTEPYPAAQVQAGELRFVSQCGFCHGRDAAGGESGPDLTRSELVASDIRGDKIGPLVRAGRPDVGMPAFRVSDAELTSIVAFIHTQASKFATLSGGRRSVDAADLATGNAADGRGYFNGAGGCSGCHSATGDLAGIAMRYDALTLLERMLYPSGRPAPGRPNATVTLASGQTITGPLAAEDEFSVVVLDPQGARQTYSKDAVKVKIDDPMSAHFTQLGKYTDAEIHNVYAYLETLK
ncbi:MAG TPA: c-type cytochrome [Bryobacteraceae bacterium]|nr:c-type cytochrome [Bryobacteraceae bacterium]